MSTRDQHDSIAVLEQLIERIGDNVMALVETRLAQFKSEILAEVDAKVREVREIRHRLAGALSDLIDELGPDEDNEDEDDYQDHEPRARGGQ